MYLYELEKKSCQFLGEGQRLFGYCMNYFNRQCSINGLNTHSTIGCVVATPYAYFKMGFLNLNT